MRGLEMARSKRVFSPEFREDAVRLVIDSSRPIAQVARELGIGEATLGNWVNKYRRDHAGEEAPLSVSDRARLREVERQLREVRMENEFLKKSVLRPGSPVSEKYEFIETMLISFQKYIYPVSLMCLWLSVSRSGFYPGSLRSRVIAGHEGDGLVGVAGVVA